MQEYGFPAGIAREANDADETATSAYTAATALLTGRGLSKRAYQRSTMPIARSWHTHGDPFASIWDEIHPRLE